MCASFILRKRQPIQFKNEMTKNADLALYYDKLIVPHSRSPVIVSNRDDLILTEMKFSLLPSWSKEPKVKFATHNARVETLASKPTWKGPLKSRHCLILMTDFIEPIYTGEFAGNMVAFSETREADCLLAAGLWDEWVNKETGEITHSFTIITTEPPSFIAKTGHDRCPIFLSNDKGIEWLTFTATRLEEISDWLLSNQIVHNFKVEIFRPMKPGWEKRA